MKWLVGISIYLAGAVWTAGAMNAHARADWYRWPNLCAEPMYVARESREQYVLAIFTGVIPPGWIAAILITGAYQDGWTMKSGPACNAEGLIT